MKVILVYIPVLHTGYVNFLTKHKDAEILYIFGKDIISKYDYLAKEIRALDPKFTRKAIKSWNILKNVEILDFKNIRQLASTKVDLVIPNEDVTLELVNDSFPNSKVTIDNIFLRWDKHSANAEKAVDIDQEISKKDFDRKIIRNIKQLAETKSTDWWRRVGAAIIKDNQIILEGYNKHVPSPHTPYANGDPRNSFHKGVNLDLSTAIHAEAGLIAEAARQGINLSGCEMYVSTFPCPPCAKSIAYSGISKLYYSGGYGVLDAETILKNKGVQIIFVDLHD